MGRPSPSASLIHPMRLDEQGAIAGTSKPEPALDRRIPSLTCAIAGAAKALGRAPSQGTVNKHHFRQSGDPIAAGTDHGFDSAFDGQDRRNQTTQESSSSCVLVPCCEEHQD